MRICNKSQSSTNYEEQVIQNTAVSYHTPRESKLLALQKAIGLWWLMPKEEQRSEGECNGQSQKQTSAITHSFKTCKKGKIVLVLSYGILDCTLKAHGSWKLYHNSAWPVAGFHTR